MIFQCNIKLVFDGCDSAADGCICVRLAVVGAMVLRSLWQWPENCTYSLSHRHNHTHAVTVLITARQSTSASVPPVCRWWRPFSITKRVLLGVYYAWSVSGVDSVLPDEMRLIIIIIITISASVHSHPDASLHVARVPGITMSLTYSLQPLSDMYSRHLFLDFFAIWTSLSPSFRPKIFCRLYYFLYFSMTIKNDDNDIFESLINDW